MNRVRGFSLRLNDRNTLPHNMVITVTAANNSHTQLAKWIRVDGSGEKKIMITITNGMMMKWN